MIRPTQRFLFILIVPLVLLISAAQARAQCPRPPEGEGTNHIQMLVLGDSILWGQGLKEHQKSWFRVKCWLEEATGRIVDVEVKAHSGALVEGPPSETQLFRSKSKEVNLPLPSINEEMDDALKFYGDGARVNLVLVDGCINDVDVRNLLNASISTETIRERTKESCGGAMTRLLRRITTAFPNAHVILPSYYRIVSEQTNDNVFIRLLVKKLAGTIEGRRPSDKEIRERLILNSEVFYTISRASLREAVKQINEELQARSSKQKVMFTDIQFAPEHAFSAKDSLLWTFVFDSTNLSGFRKFLVAVTFGTAAYDANDSVRKERIAACKETYKKPKGKEDANVKRGREGRLLACRYASLGHPNQMGALVYTEAIKGQLQLLMASTGWLSNP